VDTRPFAYASSSRDHSICIKMSGKQAPNVNKAEKAARKASENVPQDSANVEVPRAGSAKWEGQAPQEAPRDGASVALSPAIGPLLVKMALDDAIAVTYTTRSGDVFTTLKSLRPMPSMILSQHPDHPTQHVAMVGFPQLGAELIRTLAANEGCFVTFIVEDNEERIKAARAEINGLSLQSINIISSKDYSQVLMSDVKMVYFCGSSNSKTEMVRNTLSARKGVMCDKPLAPTAAETKELFATAREMSQVLLVNLPGRPGKAFSATIMSLLAGAARIQIERIVNPSFTLAPRRKIDPNDPSTEALMINMAMHDVFAVGFTICMRPTSVMVTLMAGEKAFEAEFEYPNLMVLVVKVEPTLMEHETQKFTLTGEKLIEMRRVDQMDRANSYEHPNDAKGVQFSQAYDEAERDALEQFYAAVSDAKELAPRVRPQLMEQNLLDCLRISDAALVSLRTKKKIELTYW